MPVFCRLPGSKVLSASPSLSLSQSHWTPLHLSFTYSSNFNPVCTFVIFVLCGLVEYCCRYMLKLLAKYYCGI
uniref:Uncharacterized protein LOC105117773 n=1 Tax=Rhizophora mucronata TaxID=61149 RepID=A0A2P2JUJ6_RHIMU